MSMSGTSLRTTTRVALSYCTLLRPHLQALYRSSTVRDGAVTHFLLVGLGLGAMRVGGGGVA